MQEYNLKLNQRNLNIVLMGVGQLAHTQARETVDIIEKQVKAQESHGDIPPKVNYIESNEEKR